MRTRTQLQSRLTELQAKSSYSKSSVMKNSHKMVKRYGGFNGDYLRQCAKEEKARVNKVAEEIETLIYKIENYNYLSKAESDITRVTQAGYNSTRTIGYLNAGCNS